jgi:hypothetical protein
LALDTRPLLSLLLTEVRHRTMCATSGSGQTNSTIRAGVCLSLGRWVCDARPAKNQVKKCAERRWQFANPYLMVIVIFCETSGGLNG